MAEHREFPDDPELSPKPLVSDPVDSVRFPDGEFHATFNFEGHRVIALMAMADLAARAPGTRARVEQILNDGDRSLVDAATFPDDIRDEQPETKPFHFIDIKFRDGGAESPPFPGPPHVLSQMRAFSDVLRSNSAGATERVDALSWLIHLFGDVHQPLHCITRVSDLHPDGDRGGNAFRLSGPARNLHSLWDSSLDPFSGLDEQQLADTILAQHPRESLAHLLAIFDPGEWARASHRLARTFAYSLREDPQNPPQPTNLYKETMQRHGRKQAALAAYRLANRLREILA